MPAACLMALTSLPTLCRFALVATGAAALSLALATGAAASGGGGHGAKPAKPTEHAEDSEAAEEHAPKVVVPARFDLLDLGAFRFRSSRPTDREVIDMKFSLSLVLVSELTESEFHEIDGWKNRLRDQALIAVRTAQATDFVDPALRRLERLIMFRIKRLPIGQRIIGVYVTDFSVDEGESAAEQLAPLIIPPAPVEKKPAGGGHH